MPRSRYLTALAGEMKRLNISQNELAAELELSPPQVSRWFTENEERRVAPNVLTLEAMEDAVRVIAARG